MVDLYAADIRCSSEDTRLEHEGTIMKDLTLKEALVIIKEEIDKDKEHSCICLDDLKIVLKYKFGNEIVCPAELIEAPVDSIDHVLDDGGSIYYIKLREAA